MSQTGQVADATSVLPPRLPEGMTVRGTNSKELHVSLSRLSRVHEFKLILRVGDATAHLDYVDVECLAQAVRANFNQEDGHCQRNFGSSSNLCVFGGTIGGRRYVSLLCAGQAVRLDEEGVRQFEAEMLRICKEIDGISISQPHHGASSQDWS